MTTWWGTPEWHAYEAACGLEPGTRERERAAGIRTQVVDLARPVSDVWRDVRKSFRSLIRQHEFCVTRVAPDGLRLFKAMHTNEAGRQTRPDETWDLMQSWMDGPAPHLFVFAHVVQQPAVYVDAFAGFYAHGVYGYYGHAAAIRPNVNHAVVWQAMLALAARGVRWFEVGYLDGSTREVFRRGFGGQPMMTDELDRMVTHGRR